MFKILKFSQVSLEWSIVWSSLDKWSRGLDEISLKKLMKYVMVSVLTMYV